MQDETEHEDATCIDDTEKMPVEYVQDETEHEDATCIDDTEKMPVEYVKPQRSPFEVVNDRSWRM